MCQLLYRNSETERLDLNNVEWQLAWKRNFSIHALETPPPITHFLVSSSEHQAKGYADDILITTTPANDLKDSLLTTTAPPSVWSWGRINVQHIARVSHSTQFDVRGTLIPNTALTPSKYLGSWLSTNPFTAGKVLANNLHPCFELLKIAPSEVNTNPGFTTIIFSPVSNSTSQSTKYPNPSYCLFGPRPTNTWRGGCHLQILLPCYPVQPGTSSCNPSHWSWAKSKISFLTSLMSSSDPLIQEIVKNEDSAFTAQSKPSLFHSAVTRASL